MSDDADARHEPDEAPAGTAAAPVAAGGDGSAPTEGGTEATPTPEEQEVAEVLRLADEGMLIAESALRMRVKNRIVVQVMGRGEPLTPQDCREYVIAEADALIAETRASADYLGATYDEVDRFGFGGPKGTYGRDDLKSLDLRQQVDEELVRRLEAGRNDSAYRSAIADEARMQAMNEMFRARMMPPPPSGPRLDDAEREQQMRDVRNEVGLQLAAHIRAERRRARAERRKEQRRAIAERLRFWR